MTPTLVLIPILAVIVFFLIRAELVGQHRPLYVLKPIATLLVIAIALLSFLEPTRNPTYSIGVLIGLAFSFGGDVALMFQKHRKAFMVGLVLFLLAHIAYAVTFAWLGQLSALSIVSAIALLILAVGFYRLMQPNLGTMRVPIIVYIIVISIMVMLAVSTTNSSNFTATQAVLITIGAILFFISDMILAANRFWKHWQYHRISLAFYYTGQACIALAASYFV